MSDWSEEQHRDECLRRQEALDAIRHAYALGLAETECMALAYEAGIANQFYQEINNAPHR